MIDILELIINELLITISYQSRCENCHRRARVYRIDFSIQHAYALHIELKWASFSLGLTLKWKRSKDRERKKERKLTTCEGASEY